jgi:NAD(P)H-flavin reductase
MTPRSAALRFLFVDNLAISRAGRKHSLERQVLAVRAHSSTSTQNNRKLPQSRPPFRLKQWQRNLSYGILGAGLAYTSYELYSNKQSRDSFIPYKLVEKNKVSSTASIFVLEPQQKLPDPNRYNEAWQKGIWSVQIKQPQLQIVRAYTPLPYEDSALDKDSGRLRFLIRHDMYGEVSSYLHNLPVGSQIELRGPNVEYEISPDVKQIVFIAGGTGVAPALQAARVLFGSNDGGKGKRLHILWASRKRDDCVGGRSDQTPAEQLAFKSKITNMFSTTHPDPKETISEEQGVIVKELERLKGKHPGQITVQYFVNQEKSHIDQGAIFSALDYFDDKDFSLGPSAPHEQRQVLISGPNGFISYLAGPKEWQGGRERQGTISNILAHVLATSPHNVKIWKI